MKLKKASLLVLATLALASCAGGDKPYGAAIRDNVGSITDVVLHDVLSSLPVNPEEVEKLSRYTMMCVHINKINDSAKDVTLNLTDFKAYLGNAVYTPVKFAKSIGHYERTEGETKKTYNCAVTTTDTFELKKDEHETIPDVYLCFENKKIEKTVVIKIKDQEINHDLSNPTKIDL